MSDETVFISSQRGGKRGPRQYHTDPDCHVLDRAVTVHEKDPDILSDEFEECLLCADDVHANRAEVTEPNATRRRLEELNPDDLGLSPMGERADQPGGEAGD